MPAPLALIALVARLAVPTAPPPPAEPVSFSTAGEVDLTAESLAIAGLTVAQAQDVLVELANAGEMMASLQAAHATFASRSVDLLAAEAALLAAPGEPSLVAARDAAIENVESAIGSVSTNRAAIRTVALGAFPDAVRATVQTHAANVGWIVPPEFRVLDHAPETWTTIELALRAEQRAARLDGELAEAHEELLTSIRSNPKVTQAKANLEANLDAMSQMFDLPELQ